LNNDREKAMVNRVLLGAIAAALPLLAAGAESSAASSGDAGVELTTILDSYSKHSGKKLIIDPRVRAQVPLAGLDPNRLTWPQLLTVLSALNFAAYQQGDTIVVAPDVAARQFPVQVFTDTKFKAEDGEWVGLFVTPKNACAAWLVPVLRPMMPQAAHLAAATQQNTLIIVDHADNVRRIADMVDKLDRATPAGRGCDESKK